MSRDSSFYRFAVFSQRFFPFFLFLPFECLFYFVYSFLRHPKRSLFILALPRSGSTLTYQIILSSFTLNCLTNLSHFFYRIPLFGFTFGFLLSSILDVDSSYKSSYGFVPGLNGPAEGHLFWNYWFRYSLHDTLDTNNNVFSATLRKKSAKAAKLIELLSTILPPFCSCYVGHLLHLDSLEQSFHGAVFVRLHRDPLLNALSIFNCLNSQNLNWFSVFPNECVESIDSSNHYKAACQVFWLNKRLDIFSSRTNCYHMHYEDLCADPDLQMKLLAEYCSSHGLSLTARQITIPSLTQSSLDDYNPNDVIAIRNHLQHLSDTYS